MQPDATENLLEVNKERRKPVQKARLLELLERVAPTHHSAFTDAREEDGHGPTFTIELPLIAVPKQL